jgi:hypothetical protein
VRFPDPNIGYVFGYDSTIKDGMILVTFLWGLVKIPFRFSDIEHLRRDAYRGGRISWDLIRWGKCPPGTEAVRILMKRGLFKHHMVVFDNLEDAMAKLKDIVEK